MADLSSESKLPELPPQSPAAAFERFIELVRTSPPVFDADPETVLSLIRPFLANPVRDEPHVRQISQAYAAALLGKALNRIPLMKHFSRLVMWGKPTMEDHSPRFIDRLRALESALLSELRPGSISLNLKPIRYLDSPEGFGAGAFHRYRIQVQTLIESTADDAMDAVAIELAVGSGADDAIVDDISPQAGFSAVALKQTAGVQLGRKYTSSNEVKAGAEISGPLAKVSTEATSGSVEQASILETAGGESTLARVEQYLIARMIGNRAMWRALAGVGPIDASGASYTADVLVPAKARSLDVRVDARVEWLHAGAVPAELRQTLELPHPPPKPQSATRTEPTD
jgi:hypothetical protein